MPADANIRARATPASLDRSILLLVLQYSDQRTVLHIAAVCAHWRRVAIRSSRYYRFVRLSDARWGAKRFLTALEEARNGSYAVSVVFKVRADRWDAQTRALLTEAVLPAITATLRLTKKLDISVPPDLYLSLFTALETPAPLLEQLRLTLIKPEFVRHSGGTDAANGPAVPADILRSEAPLLRHAGLSGLALGSRPVDVFRNVTHLTLHLDFPFQQLDLATHFPEMRNLVLSVDDDAFPDDYDEEEDGFDDGAVTLPSSLAVLDLRCLGESIGDLLDVFDPSRLPEVRAWCEYSEFAADWKPFLEPLRSAPDVALRLFFEQSLVRQDDKVTVPIDVRASIETPGRVWTFYADEEGYNPHTDRDDQFDSFPAFSFLSPLSKSITSIIVTHEFIPLLFQHFKSLAALKRLEIDLDTFRLESGPFWYTHSTKEEGDYSDGDETPLPWPTNARPGRRRFPGGGHPEDCSESGEDCDDDGYTPAESRVIDRAYALGALNHFDSEPEEHQLLCRHLDFVRLRSGYQDTSVQTRQLAHFGRALGLLKRKRDSRPRLLLRGVRLSSAKRGTLHLHVFREVVEEPVTYLKAREKVI